MLKIGLFSHFKNSKESEFYKEQNGVEFFEFGWVFLEKIAKVSHLTVFRNPPPHKVCFCFDFCARVFGSVSY